MGAELKQGCSAVGWWRERMASSTFITEGMHRASSSSIP